MARPGKAFHHAYPEKPWPQIVAMRNVLFHKHSGGGPGSGLGDVEGNEAMARAVVRGLRAVCYVRAEAEKMKRLVVQLREQQSEAAILDAAIAANLKKPGYGG